MATAPRTPIIIDRDVLPRQFPTQQHSPEFWEHLGRVIATFGYLEEIIGKAIFAFTATTEYGEKEVKDEFDKWEKTLTNALANPLNRLICSYSRAVKRHQHAELSNIEVLIDDLRKAAKVRNALCHGSWRGPDADGKSTVYFLSNQSEIFDAQIDVHWLVQLQLHLQDLICDIIESVTVLGWRFPSSTGPGEEIWPIRKDGFV